MYQSEFDELFETEFLLLENKSVTKFVHTIVRNFLSLNFPNMTQFQLIKHVSHKFLNKNFRH